jgi:hypothetical protein
MIGGNNSGQVVTLEDAWQRTAYSIVPDMGSIECICLAQPNGDQTTAYFPVTPSYISTRFAPGEE